MKKLFAFMMVVFMLASSMLFAGGGNQASAEAPAAAAANTDVAPAKPEAVADESDVTLVYWSMWEATEPQGIVLKEAIDDFIAETGIKVDVQFKGRNGIRQGIQAALDANTNIDIFDEGVDRVLGNWGNYLLDLEDYVAASNYEETANAVAMSAIRELSGEGLKGVPYQMSIYGWFYNPEIFEKAGVTNNPTTWDEFLDVCAKIKAAGYTPITSDDAYFLTTFGYHISRYGGIEAVADAVKNGNWANNEAVIKATQDYEELYKLGYLSEFLPSNTFPAGQNGEFALGDAAMYFNGSWLPNEIKSMAGEDFVWGCFPYPNVEGGLNDTTYNNLSFRVFVINEKSAHPAEAFQLLEWLTQGKWDSKLTYESISVPSDTRNAEWPAQLVNVKPLIEETKTYFVTGAGISANSDIKPILQDMLFQLVDGKITAQEFIDGMQAVADGAK